MSSAERTPQEQETLVHATTGQAAEFQQEIAERVDQQNAEAVASPREAVAEVVAEEIAQHGHGVSELAQPWEHNEAEHQEAQALVDIAFDRDLPTALAKARASDTYPRNLDLFHDVLTNELYEMLVEHKLNRQPLAGWSLLLVVVVLVAVVVSLLVVVFT